MIESMNWNNIYLLGWYDRNKRAYLTTWEGDAPIVDVVVTGTRMLPMWDARVPTEAKIVKVPTGVDPHEYAAQCGGLYAIGWELPEGVERK